MGIIGIVFLLGEDRVWDAGLPNDIITLGRQGHAHPIGHAFNPLSLLLRLNSMGQQSITSLIPNFHDAFLTEARDLKQMDVVVLEDIVDQSTSVSVQVLKSTDINFVDYEEFRLVCKKWLDGMKQLALSFNCVAALFRKIHEIQDARAQVCHGGDGLHFDRVHLI